ncbi:very-long-chain 3-oxoacyl-CoA reductase 1-like isoform X1 [Magnolia sinica]|uniref:very-long-chain 3-oxoacyl-CoA reductase 1-like isoform X1 n=1 Tax=Magnolia sinica TaxID=86752 RepID=UPI00265A13DA|nr:very-long-chain 3-oxoacyl-CoA reductase 1-like isoform X1 [Magnolia sinica]
MSMHVIFIVANAVGFITLSKFLLSFCTWVWVTFLRPPKNLKGYGSWAMVTGSTDGIGKAFAFELASKGLNLILVGRSPTKLKATISGLHERYGCQVMVRSVVIDFSNDPLDVIDEKIKKGIDGLDVGILINNVGISYPWPRYFHEVASTTINDLLKVNVESTTWVTRAVLPLMLKKKKGAIINIGSGSTGVLPSFPLYAIYCATKAYVYQFSRSLHVEYKQHGIDVQCQIPLLVQTKMIALPLSSFFIPTPEVYSKACIRWIGHEPFNVPYWRHSLEAALLSALPEALIDECIIRYFFTMRKIEQERINKE